MYQQQKENLHGLLNAGGYILPKDKEKEEVLNGSFDSVFNSMTSGSQGIQFPKLKDRDRENSPEYQRKLSVTCYTK